MRSLRPFARTTAFALIVSTGVISSQASAVVIGTFSAPANTASSQTFSYTPASAGRVSFTMNNPDQSRDGVFAVLMPQYTSSTGSYFNYVDVSTFERAGSYDTFGGNGLRSTKLSVAVGTKPLSIYTEYALQADNRYPLGTDFTGINSLVIEYEPKPISFTPENYLGTFNPGPRELISRTFNISGPGEIVVNATSTGSFGGGRFSYILDGVAIGGTNMYINRYWATQPFTVALSFGPGDHVFTLAHEDPGPGDNYGVLSADVYFNAVPLPSGILLLGGLMLFGGWRIRSLSRQ